MKLFVTLRKTKPWIRSKNISHTDEAVDHVILYCHQLFNHPGHKRLLDGMSRYFHPKLRQKNEHLHCKACQKFKVNSQSYGLLPPRDVGAAPLEQADVDVDLKDPWTVQTRTMWIYEFSALTSIERVTGLAKLIRIDNKKSDHVAVNLWSPGCQDTQDPSRVVTTTVTSLLIWNFRKLCQTLE